jgi:hypothetical protein
MGKIINKKNVEIIVDGLELLRKYLQEISPINNIFHSTNNNPDSFYSKYSINEVDSLLDDIKNSNFDE